MFLRAARHQLGHRAIGVQLVDRVMKGQPRPLKTGPPPRSVAQCGRICTIPKLTARVRFPSPAPSFVRPAQTKHFRQQCERRHMSRDQGEVTVIDRGDLGNTETFRDGDYGHVSRVEASILVGTDELGHAPHVGRKQIDQLELFNHVIKELRVYAEPICLLMIQPASIRTVEGSSSGPSSSSRRRRHEAWCLSSRSTMATKGPVSKSVAFTLTD